MFSTKNYFLNKFNKSEHVAVIFIAVLTAIASELKVIPFNGEVFRFGLGSITFFFLILIRRPTFLVRTGFITGVTVVVFRLFIDAINHIPLLISLKNHLPAFLFYFLFALGLSILNVEKYKSFPLLLGAVATGLEIIANTAEHMMRFLLTHENFGFHEFALVCGVALFRSYFVVGLYSSITITEQKKRMQEMLEVGSELYAESLYLQKSMNHIEKITASSHDLYRKLKKNNLQELSVQALHITQEIHEVKKDSQRILSGISKITNEKGNDIFLLSDILDFVVTANEKYSLLLKKNITFNLAKSIDFETEQQIPLLALLNNITSNAVESILNKGTIDIKLFEEGKQLCFVIKDSGKGIRKEDVPIIFEPGYTTKFNDRGVAATGIGLSHVQEIIQSFNGRIQIETPGNGTIFKIFIPIKNIRKRVE